MDTGPEPAPLAPNWLLAGLLVVEVKVGPGDEFPVGPWSTGSEQTQEWSLAGS